MGLLQTPSVAIDCSKFKAVNNRDRNFTHARMARRMAQIEQSVGRYLRQLDSADRQEPSEAITIKTTRIREKIARLKQEMGRLEVLDAEMRNTPDQQISLTDPDVRSMATSRRGPGVVGYNVQVGRDARRTAGFDRPVPTGGRLCRSLKGEKPADLPIGTAADEVSACHQHQDCSKAAKRWPRSVGAPPADRRRGDRIGCNLLHNPEVALLGPRRCPLFAPQAASAEAVTAPAG
jgi:hypothetical protein